MLVIYDLKIFKNPLSIMEYTIIVVGNSGIGKSTFFRMPCDWKIYT